MRKIKIDTLIKIGEKDSTVGEQLHGLLEGLPTENAKIAVRQLQIADDLKESNENKSEWFVFEDADLVQIQNVTDLGARKYGPFIIAPIQIAIDEVVTFKGEEPKE